MNTRFYARKTWVLIWIALSVTLYGYSKNPDLSGSWKLNKPGSTMNAEFSFAPLTLRITQEKNSLTLERDYEFQGNQMTMSDSYTLDGKESINEGWQDSETVSIASWGEKGKILTIVTTIETMDGSEMKIHAAYSMDGKSLKIASRVEGGPMGGGEGETWIYDKQ
jgi:hypothetical protein